MQVPKTWKSDDALYNPKDAKSMKAWENAPLFVDEFLPDENSQIKEINPFMPILNKNPVSLASVEL